MARSFTSNPNLERVRLQAVLLVKQGHTTHGVARHFGNAHSSVERFNRSLQDESVSSYQLRGNLTQQRLDEYLDYYNNGQRHMGIMLRRSAELVQKY